MLIKGNDVLKLKVVSKDTGAFVEDVDDLIYDPTSHQVKALLVSKGGWFNKPKVIMFQDIQSIGEDAIMIQSEDIIKKTSDVDSKVANISEKNEYLTHTKIVTEDGKQLGTVTDIYFDSTTGKVVELEVSQGGLKNLQSGHKRVKVADVLTIGEDATIIRSLAEEKMEAQAQQQGVQGAVNATANKTKSIATQAKQKTQTLYDKSKHINDKPIMKEAKAKGQSLFEKTRESLIAFDQKAREKAEEIKHSQKAKQAMATLKEKTDTFQKDMTDNRKKEATGKYVTVNILTPPPQERIIAKRGDMITYKLIHEAEQSGILDKVLNNTSEKPIETTPAQVS